MTSQVTITIGSPCSLCAMEGELIGELGTCSASAYPHCEDCHINFDHAQWRTCKYVDVEE